MTNKQVKQIAVAFRQDTLKQSLNNKRISMGQIVKADNWKGLNEENRLFEIPNEILNLRCNCFLTENQILEALEDGLYAFAIKDHSNLKIYKKWFKVENNKIV